MTSNPARFAAVVCSLTLLGLFVVDAARRGRETGQQSKTIISGSKFAVMLEDYDIQHEYIRGNRVVPGDIWSPSDSLQPADDGGYRSPGHSADVILPGSKSFVVDVFPPTEPEKKRVILMPGSKSPGAISILPSNEVPIPSPKASPKSSIPIPKGKHPKSSQDYRKK